jgi:ABC-type uncharacterized transport system involved in gliding motility auxiliary subunit
MKPEWRRFAPLGLYLALIALLVSIGLFIVQREFNLALQISLGLIVVGLALFAILDPDRVRRILTGRQARYGSNALVLILAFVGIVIVINYLVYQNPKRWDLTEDKEFTLSPETLDTLKSVEQPIHAQAFYSENMRSTQGDAERLLDQYAFQSDGKFTYEFIDPIQNPVAAEQAKITRDGTIVVNMGGNQEPATFASEQELTGAIVRLMNPESRAVYFLLGHGEFSPEGAGDRSYAQAKVALEGKNYAVKTLNLLGANEIPADADVIVVAGPTKPLSSDEVSLLSDYLANGGALIVMEEPPLFTEFGESPDPLAEYLAQIWGINQGQDLVIDLSSNQPMIAFGVEWGQSTITQDLQTSAGMMPTARSVSVSPASSGASTSILVSTSQNSWAETDQEALKSENPQVQPDENVDLLGPVPLSVQGEDFTTQGRVVVFGDADFASDQFVYQYANLDFFVNSVDWSVGNEQLISLTPKNTTQRMVVPPQQVAMNLILLGTVFILPGIALVGGIVVWVQRRRRG